jgi:hypothetical protein
MSCFPPFCSYDLHCHQHTSTPRDIVNTPTIPEALCIGLSVGQSLSGVSERSSDGLYDGQDDRQDDIQSARANDTQQSPFGESLVVGFVYGTLRDSGEKS